MTLPRFFAPRLEPGKVELPLDEGHHAAHVLRLRRGAAVCLFDGEGGEADAVIADVRRGRVEVEVARVRPSPLPRRSSLTLAVAPPKGPRQATLVEKCTELGVDALQPLLTQRGVARAGPEITQRWRRWTVEAAKQCGRLWLPRVLEAMRFLDVAARRLRVPPSLGVPPKTPLPPWGRGQSEGVFGCTLSEDAAWIAHPAADATPLADRLRGLAITDHVVLHIGPEGGWTEEELAAAAGAGMSVVRLSDAILRTETAAIAAVAVWRMLLEESGGGDAQRCAPK